MAEKAAILRWTGRGSMADLKASVGHVAKARKLMARVERVGDSLVLTGAEPVGACLVFEFMPGVAWGAAGYAARGLKPLAKASTVLASSYLRRGTRFAVDAQTVRAGPASDLAGTVTSAMLDTVKGARAVTENPKVRVKAALDGPLGVVGIEVAEGPGGVPTGNKTAVCLLSGGVHSSVLAWNAALSGYRVELFHAQTSEESLWAAARLYSELSYRMDPRGLSLTVAEGGAPAGLIDRFLAGLKVPAFGGFTTRPIPPKLKARVHAPLSLLTEEGFAEQFSGLKLKSLDELADWDDRSVGAYFTRAFGGRSADVSGVIDGLF
jgi:hypothetical protein